MKPTDILIELEKNKDLTIVDYLGRPIEYFATTKDGRIVLSIKKPIGICKHCSEKVFETIAARGWCITCNKTVDI